MGNSQALFVMTRFNSTRFEFIFTSLVKNSPRLFTTVQAVFKSYETTKLYRDLKLRGAIIRDKELVMLPHEQVYEKIGGIWNFAEPSSATRSSSCSRMSRSMKKLVAFGT